MPNKANFQDRTCASASNREPLRADIQMMADGIRYGQVNQEPHDAMRHAEEIQVAIAEIDPGANVSAGKSHQHEEPVGQVRQGEQCCRKQGNASLVSQETGEPVDEVTVQQILLKKSPGKIHGQARESVIP